MNVKCAKEHIDKIIENCTELNNFTEKHDELAKETGFLVDTVSFLCDYRRVLERAIEKAELDI